MGFALNAIAAKCPWVQIEGRTIWVSSSLRVNVSRNQSTTIFGLLVPREVDGKRLETVH